MHRAYSLSVRRVVRDRKTYLVIEDAAHESGKVIDARLIGVPGTSLGDAVSRLKGRCFTLADEAEPELAAALRQLGHPDIDAAQLQTTLIRDMLASPMTKALIPWITATGVLILAGTLAICHGPRPSRHVPSSRALGVTARVYPEKSSQPPDHQQRSEELARVSTRAHENVTRSLAHARCEPLHWAPCPELGKPCTPMPDGTPRQCRQRKVDGVPELVCVPGVPGEKIKRWRRARLRTIVESICETRNGCRPGELTDYLTVMVDRETSRRPWKRHRLDVDTEAAAKAWKQHAIRYEDSPAADEPWRWATGLGYFGQNPALWLWRWDDSAEPETLCGEVESVLVHLRGARQRWKHVHGIFACGEDAQLFAGTSTAGVLAARTDSHDWGHPSWYDVSQVNSGSEACPAQPGDGKRWEVRQSFARRMKRYGRDAYAPITLAMLGKPVSAEDQDAFVAELYTKLDKEHPTP